MSEKVTVKKYVGKAIDKLRNDGLTDCEIVAAVQNDQERFGPESYVDFAVIADYFGTEAGLDDAFLSALVNGYKVDKSPEEKVREYYEEIKHDLKDPQDAEHEEVLRASEMIVRDVLGLLNIKISGVNVNK